jgi:hypothetical protein
VRGFSVGGVSVTQTLPIPSQISSGRQKYVIGHFDAHGTSTVAAYARSNNVPVDNVYVKFPDTGPERITDFIDTFFPTLVKYDVVMIDIPVNLKNPRAWVDAVNRLAMNTSVTIYDHHETDVQFIPQLIARMVVFPNATRMAEVLSDENNRTLAYIGVIADRDSSILSTMSRDEVERLMSLANVLDVLVRQDVQTVRNLITTADPIQWLRAQAVSVAYPPAQLMSSVEILRRGYNTLLIDMTKLPQSAGGWSWKIMELVAYINNIDYVVAINQTLDRQTNQQVPIVQVIRYWLSNRPSPRPQLQPIMGRQTIGHDDAFSIRAMDLNDARQLADQLFNHLEALTPRVTHLVNDANVAEAVRADFNTILQLLVKILQQQNEMYREYLDLKKQQVELLRRTADTRTRAD